MKTIQLIVTSLLATTAWADSKKPYAFFAEVNNKLEPLSGAVYKDKNFNVNILSYGNSSRDPVVFNLDGDYATATDKTTPGSVWYYKGALVFGGEVNPGVVELDSDFTIRGHTFKSCEMLDPPVRGITYRPTNGIPTKDCFDVKLFLLPYDEKTRMPVAGMYTPPKDEGNKSEDKEPTKKKKKTCPKKTDEKEENKDNTIPMKKEDMCSGTQDHCQMFKNMYSMLMEIACSDEVKTCFSGKV